ncbi:MAG: ABC transporter substrate-binding protein [Defluviitaleaceae bacterium]|nr:ABC transporter substrate-binding protein [Defluviitaleaceae bacterium]
MSKKIFMLLLTLIGALAIFAACGNDQAGDQDVEITLINNKVEIDGALRDFARLYEEMFGVRVNIHSFGGETPYAPSLAALLAGGDEPEIFVFEGMTDFLAAQAGGRVLDMSDQPWVNDTSMEFRYNGRVYGFPVALEGWGLGYNTRILREAGIDPATLTNVNAIRNAFETIDAMRDELGLVSVVSMAAGPGMTWVTGLHGTNAYLSLGLAYEDTRIIDMLNNGQVDEQRLLYFAEYYNLLFQFANPSTMLVGGFDDQIGDFATERTAFIHQGNWIDPVFEEWGVNFEMGYVPHAFLPTNVNGIFVGAPSWYLVNPRSDNHEAALAFLQFMAGSPEGHRYMVVYAGAVPAFYSVPYSPAGPLSRAVTEWSARGAVYAWHQNDMPAGFGMDTLGPIYELMASGAIDAAEFARLFTNAVAALN